MHSMTGFGRGVVEQVGTRATIDVRAVNHRFLDIKLRGAPIAPALEEAITSRVRAAVERGSIVVSIHLGRVAVDGVEAGIVINAAVAEAVHRALSQLSTRLGVPGPNLNHVLAQPGVVIAVDRAPEADAPVVPALEAALAQLTEMRRTEGAALAIELGVRLDELTRLRAQVATLAAEVPQQLTKRLRERVQRLLEPSELAALDPARLAQEIALLADRADITEELVRLASHLDQARALVAASEPSGRRLDFLVQEIGRELNTIGSKSTATEITGAIVEAKAALEKLREQVQNVE